MRSSNPQQSGQSGIHLLSDGVEAFAARAALTVNATTSIDAQYYLWRRDLVGLSLLWLLNQAADRGVKVRVLLDDVNLGTHDFSLAALSTHPNFDLRVFNPFRRGGFRLLQYLTRFGSVTRRMHNKSFTVDQRATIVGGRNIANEYFAADPQVVYGDLDAFAIGPIVTQVSRSFSDYWDHPMARPIEALSRTRPTDKDRKRLSIFLEQQFRANNDSVFLQALRKADFADRFKARSLDFKWGAARLLADSPQKLGAPRHRRDLMLNAGAGEVVATIKSELLIFSPYLLPGKAGTRGLLGLVGRGVDINILTNSLASNDHAVVHAKYARYRVPLLQAGIALFEVKARPTGNSGRGGGRIGRRGFRRTVFHAKSFLIDRRFVFVGSLNFDPRSAVENTEIGMLIDSPELAREIGEWFDQRVKVDAFELALEPSGKPAGKGRLVWIDHAGQGGRTTYHREPQSSWQLRLTSRLMAMLPVESQL